jgi:hypothetical protein
MDETLHLADLLIMTTILAFAWFQWYTNASRSDRLDEIETALAQVCHGIIQKIDDLKSQATEINLVNQNPIASFVDLIRQFKGEPPLGDVSKGMLTNLPRSDDGRFTQDIDDYASTTQDTETPTIETEDVID